MKFAVEWSNFNMRTPSLKEHHQHYKALCLSLSLCVSLSVKPMQLQHLDIILKKWSVQFFGNTSGAPSGWVHELLLHDHVSHELRLVISIHVWLWSLSDWIFYNHFDALWNFFLNFFNNLWIPTPFLFFLSSFFHKVRKEEEEEEEAAWLFQLFNRLLECFPALTEWMNNEF